MGNGERLVSEVIYSFLESRYPGLYYAEIYARYMGEDPMKVLEKWSLVFDEEDIEFEVGPDSDYGGMLYLVAVDIHEIVEAIEIMNMNGRITPIHEGKSWYRYYVKAHPIAADAEISFLSQYKGTDFMINEVKLRRDPKPWSYFEGKGLKPVNGVRYIPKPIRSVLTLVWNR